MDKFSYSDKTNTELSRKKFFLLYSTLELMRICALNHQRDDPQPHPEDAALATTFPHHLHEPPDIEHHRQPAPGISFTSPNLPTLIETCIQLGQ